ncbi:MAG: hypothetical protein ACRCVT_04925, partial [Leadbetterella sp.]
SGLTTGDLIKTVDGKAFKNISQIAENKKIGDKVTLGIIRAYVEKEITVTLQPNKAINYSLEVKSNLSDLEKKMLNKFLHSNL